MAHFRRALSTLLLVHCIRNGHGSFLGLYDDACDDETTVRPNIVMLLLDDLGYSDIHINGGEFPTPNIDSFMNNSVKISHHYVHLMGSPSRTQFLTGRYAMNLGLGEFETWSYKQMIGIPLGQPTLANWLGQFGTYTTYAVGKWNLGYANTNLLPKAKGFDHFYGFYQGAISYNQKRYYDVDDGMTDYYDFWEDGLPSDDAMASNASTLKLYSDKIAEYLAEEGAKRRHKRLLAKRVEPFFLYYAMQSMHAPFIDPDTVPIYHTLCDDMLSDDGLTGYARRQRTKYCVLTLLTDKYVGELVS